MIKNGKSGAPNVLAFLQNPSPAYVPLADISFGGREIVLPHELPPTSQQFPNATFNKMLNLPSIETIWDYDRTRRVL